MWWWEVDEMKEILKLAAARADEADLFYTRTARTLVAFENNKLKEIDTIDHAGVALRVFRQGRLGESCSSNLAAREEIVERALASTEFGDPVKFCLPEPQPVGQLKLVRREAQQWSTEQMVQEGGQILKIIQEYDPSILTSVTFARTLTEVRVLNTRGVDAGYQRLEASFGIVAELVEEKNIIQILKTYRGLVPCADPLRHARECVQEFKVARNTVHIKTGKYPVIFAPSALGDIFMAFVGGINGDQVAKRLSPLTGKLGEKILDERVTIIDDNLHPEGTQSGSVDDEGVPGQRTVLVERGVLKNYLLDLKSAAELGMNSTGNGLRLKRFEYAKSYTVSVGIDFTNLVLAPGAMSYEQMLSATELGLEVHHITGILLGNLLNGDFSGSVEMGFKIQNGRRVGRVKDTMIAGNFYRLFGEQLIALEERQHWSGAFGGTSGAFLLPHGYFRNVDVASKE
jgi:PmbA protein